METADNGGRRLDRSVASERLRAGLVLVALMVLIGFYKLLHASFTHGPGIDGGFYADVAANVRDGRGLVSNVSLLHQGYPYFPHPTSIYPLWPLLWGYVARLGPLLDTGKWLATGCYFATLVLAFLWVRTFAPEELFPRAFPGFGAGHVLVLMLGLDRELFRYTTLPYTEGLAYALTMLGLWRLAKLWPKPSWHAGAEMGLWCGLAVLARSQLVLMMLAAMPVLAGACALVKGHRRAYLVTTACCVAAFVATLTPHYLYLRTFIDHPGLREMLRFDEVRFTPELSRFEVLRQTPGLGAYLLDCTKGLQIAFDPFDGGGYQTHFYSFALAAPTAAVLLLATAVRRYSRADLGRARDWLLRPESLNLVFVVIFALGGWLSLHVMHKQGSSQWVFHRRHALSAVFLLFLSLWWLLRWARVPGRALGVLLLGSGIWLGWGEVRSHAGKAAAQRSKPAMPALVRWLQDHRENGRLTVVMRQPQPIAPFTEGVGYHWYSSRTRYADVEIMVSRLGADYVILPSRGSPTFASAAGWRKHFRAVGLVPGYRIFAPDAQLRHRRARAPSGR